MDDLKPPVCLGGLFNLFLQTLFQIIWSSFCAAGLSLYFFLLRYRKIFIDQSNLSNYSNTASLLRMIWGVSLPSWTFHFSEEKKNIVRYFLTNPMYPSIQIYIPCKRWFDYNLIYQFDPLVRDHSGGASYHYWLSIKCQWWWWWW